MERKRRRKRKCIVKNCRYDREVTYHRLPIDIDTRNIWLDLLDLDGATSNGRVCSKHFHSSDFHRKGDGHIWLRRNAHPYQVNEFPEDVSVPTDVEIEDPTLHDEKSINNAPPRLFTADEINKFLIEAPDSEYAAVKAVTVFAIFVSPQANTLANIKIESVKDYGTKIVVRVPNPTTGTIEVCTISGKMVDFVRNYIRLRPKTVSTDRFFIQYQDGRRTSKQTDTITKMPQRIAEYLGWPESDKLGGLTFERISSEVSMSNGSIEESHQCSIAETGRVEADEVPCVRIKQEDEQDFEASEYVLSETYYDSCQDVEIKTENCPVYCDVTSDDHRYANQDDVNRRPLNRSIPEQRLLHQRKLPDGCASETITKKRLRCSDDVDDAASSVTGCHNNSRCQRTIRAQADEIARLKQLTERQNAKIASLETLLLDRLPKKFESS